MYKRGDRVTITSTRLFNDENAYKTVTVDYQDGDFLHVTTDDGEYDYGFIEDVTLMSSAAPIVGNTKYNREIKPSVFVDVYDVLYAFKVTDPCLQHLIKKALAAGQRGHKDARQDLVDIRDSAQRALDSYDLWEVKE